MYKAEERISKLVNISVNSLKLKNRRTKTEKKKEKYVQELWDSYRRYKRCINVGIPKGEEREKGTRSNTLNSND